MSLHRAMLFTINTLLLISAPYSTPPDGWDSKTSKLYNKEQRVLSQAELTDLAQELQKTLHPSSQADSFQTRNSSLHQILQNLKTNPLQSALSLSTEHSEWDIVYDPANGTPISIISQSQMSVLPKRSDISAFQRATALIDSNNELFRITNPAEELRLVEDFTDELGMQHIRLAQYYQELPLWNQEITFHFDKTANMYSINARYSPTPSSVKTIADIDSLEAMKTAMAKIASVTTLDTVESPLDHLLPSEGPVKVSKYIWISNNCTPHLVWHVQIRASALELWYVFVDASNGEILQMYNSNSSGTNASAPAMDLFGISRNINVYDADSLYCLIDASKSMWNPIQNDVLNSPDGAIWTVSHIQQSGGIAYQNILSYDNSWSDPIAISAHYHVGVVFDYFLNTFGRLGLDNNGTTILSIVHFLNSQGGAYDNAGWSSRGFMIFGDGDYYKPFAGGLDIVAHEMTHGVIQYTVNLEYMFQSGALNESFADVFAAMVDRDDWLIGEDVGRNRPFRDMQNPSNYGQPSHMSDYRNYTSDYDNGGVHINSGIPNRACYLIGSAIGHDKTEKIYYRTLQARYLNRQSQFIDMRIAALQAAQDLYGKQSMEYSVVKSSFNEVGIMDTQPPAPEPLVRGQQLIAAINWAGGKTLSLINPASSQDTILLSATPVFTNSSSPVTIPGNGEKILFVDNSNYIRTVDLDSRDESTISTDGIWSSIASSYDGTKIAATTVWADSVIYILNLTDPAQSFSYHLYNPYPGKNPNSVLFADAINWDIGGRFLVFDSYCNFNDGSDTPQYWNILFLDTDTKEIFPVFSEPSNGISYANPSLACSGLPLFAFDHINYNAGTAEIRITDYNKKILGQIEENGNSLSFPKFSSYDSSLVFMRKENNLPSLRKISLDNSKLAPLSTSTQIASGYIYPSWFVVGGVQDAGDDIVRRNVLNGKMSVTQSVMKQTATIQYNLFSGANVKLNIFDMNGRMISNLDSGFKKAGAHSVTWNIGNSNGKAISGGMYFCRLTIDSGKNRIHQSQPLIIAK